MEHYLIRILFSTDEKNKLERLIKVEELKEQLKTEGYQPSEVEHFVKLAVGSAQINEMCNFTLNLLIEILQKQIEIAQGFTPLSDCRETRSFLSIR